jgi:hypothetical protein
MAVSTPNHRSPTYANGIQISPARVIQALQALSLSKADLHLLGSLRREQELRQWVETECRLVVVHKARKALVRPHSLRNLLLRHR